MEAHPNMATRKCKLEGHISSWRLGRLSDGVVGRGGGATRGEGIAGGGGSKMCLRM